MSYIRFGSVYNYVEGKSEDYIYPAEYKGKIYIESYGCSNETLVELIARSIDADYTEYKNFLIKKLALELNVKLRKKPLIAKQNMKLYLEEIKKVKE